jgi:predicted XRE-type DNA-binding protein
LDEFYIYIYLDPRKPGRYCYEDVCFIFEPFYVGKGKNGRWKSISGRKKDFIDIINEIKEIVLEPIVIKLFENLNEKESLDRETEFINKIGRLELKTGPLINRTSGGQGTSGYKHTEESKELVAEKNRKDFQDKKKEFEIKKYILLTEENEYKNSHETKLEYICPKGHKDSTTWGNFQQGHGCPICYNELRSENNIGENNPFFGKQHLEESKKKMSEKHKGEKHPNHKIIEEQVIQIKLLLKEGKLSQRKIAKMFGVSHSIISRIKTGKLWSHIKI